MATLVFVKGKSVFSNLVREAEEELGREFPWSKVAWSAQLAAKSAVNYGYKRIKVAQIRQSNPNIYEVFNLVRDEDYRSRKEWLMSFSDEDGEIPVARTKDDIMKSIAESAIKDAQILSPPHIGSEIGRAYLDLCQSKRLMIHPGVYLFPSEPDYRKAGSYARLTVLSVSDTEIFDLILEGFEQKISKVMERYGDCDNVEDAVQASRELTNILEEIGYWDRTSIGIREKVEQKITESLGQAPEVVKDLFEIAKALQY